MVKQSIKLSFRILSVQFNAIKCNHTGVQLLQLSPSSGPVFYFFQLLLVCGLYSSHCIQRQIPVVSAIIRLPVILRQYAQYTSLIRASASSMVPMCLLHSSSFMPWLQCSVKCLPRNSTGSLAYILFLTVCLTSISAVSMCEILATFNLMVTSHRRWLSGFIILNRGLIASHESKDLIIEIRRIEIGFYSSWVTIKNTSNTLKESLKYQGLKQDLDMGWGLFPGEKNILLT